jgi:hypothetical protein
MTLVVFIQRLSEVHGGFWLHRSKIWGEEEQEEEWHDTETQAKILDTYQKSYVLLYHACFLYVLMIVYYILYIVQCAKQPPRTILCGYYVCEYLRACSSSRNQGWWRKEKVDHRNFTRTVADICKFVTHSCMHVGQTFFNEESELATTEKYEKIKNWSTLLCILYYMLPDIGLGPLK